VFSGVANGVITADQLDVPATYEDLAAIGSGLGSAGLIVYDDTADMVAVARMFARFLNVESCGQCGACKLHSGAISDTLSLVEQSVAEDRDLEELGAALRMVTDQNRCYLPVELQTVIASIMREFPEDFVTHLEGAVPLPRLYRLPKIVDMADGAVTYDTRSPLEQPDGTYVDVRRAG
jgi:NADH-quinone oxidoreductase subunit F